MRSQLRLNRSRLLTRSADQAISLLEANRGACANADSTRIAAEKGRRAYSSAFARWQAVE
jgi:hypothetical protein